LRSPSALTFAITESLNGYRLVSKDRPDQRKPDDIDSFARETADGDAFAFKGYMAYQDVLFGVSMRVHKTAPLKWSRMIRWGISSGFTDET
jgi:hypothetical protein